MDEKTISKKRIVGSALFGFLVVGYLINALNYNIPFIISYIKHITVVEATDIFYSINILYPIILIVSVFFGSVIGAYIAKKKGVLVGILSSSLFIIGYSFLLVMSVVNQTDLIFAYGISYQLYIFISIMLIILASVLGGYYGQKVYSSDSDLDLMNDKLTLFGIRWFHYFWIMPFIMYPFFSSFLMILYSWAILILSYLYVAIHPSLWWNLFSIIYLAIIPTATYFSAYITFYAFVRFFELMRYKQIIEKGWKKAGKVIGFGVLIPIISFFISAYVSNSIHSLPSPKLGDWKIGLYILLGLVGISVLFSLYDWVKENLYSKKIWKK